MRTETTRSLAVPALLLAHGTAGLAAAFWAPNALCVTTAGFLTLVFCQSGLLGVWAGLGTTRTLLRLLCSLAGAMYLALLPAIPLRQLDQEVFSVVLLVSAVTGAVSTILRGFTGPVRRDRQAPGSEVRRSQFTLRQMLLTMVGVACALSAGKLIWPMVKRYDDLLMWILGGCFAAPALPSVWCMLGRGWLLFRLPLACLAIAPIAIATAYSIGEHHAIWAGSVCVQAVLQLATLYIVRRGGWRLTSRLRWAAEQPAAAGEPAAQM